MNLTKRTEEVLLHIYKIYKKSIESGENINEAMDFEDDFVKYSKHLQKMNPDDIDHALCELNNIEAIRRYTDGSFRLMDSSVEYMENRTRNKVEKFVDAVSKFKP